MDKLPSRNVLGGELAECSRRPMTGFFRDGCCNTSPEDRGSHTVCVVMTADFLRFSRSKPGDQWCLCAARWQEAFEAGKAPHVKLTATHERALEVCKLADLKRHAIDMN